MRKVLLQKEDFNDFPLGGFPFDPNHSAMGEYHFAPTSGYSGHWYCPMADYSWKGPFWSVAPREGRHWMENEMVKPLVQDPWRPWSTLVTGDRLWQNYEVSSKILFLNTHGLAGIAIRYQNSRQYVLFCHNGGKLQWAMRDQEEYTVLAEIDYKPEFDLPYDIILSVDGDTYTASIDGVTLSAQCDRYAKGRIALMATVPVQYTDVIISMHEEDYASFTREKAAQEADVVAQRKTYPQLKLHHKISLSNFGAGRHLRFGDLTGDGKLDMILCQHHKRVLTDRYADISCMTAFDMNGQILWQIGEPCSDSAHGDLTADLPFQIADINGDGKNEVVTVMDFRLRILEGATGRELASIPVPESTEPLETLYSGVPYGQYAFDHVNIDAVRICNFSGNPTPTDILIKDRYSRLYVYNNKLEPLWRYHDGITGHFPYTADINGDGRDEMFVGYNLVDSNGKKIWTLPAKDHTDEIIFGRLIPDSDQDYIGIVSGEEGFMILDFEGNVKVRKRICHAQRISTANYRPDLPGYETAVTNYWGSQGIIFIYDGHGNVLYSDEPGTNGNVIIPVNWTGDGRDLLLLNADSAQGGMIDGWGRQVVPFPEDGHPTQCVEVLDLLGDARDEVVVWDSKEMWFYTQDTPFTGEMINAPFKYPHNNASNYRGEYSWPHFIPYKK